MTARAVTGRASCCVHECDYGAAKVRAYIGMIGSLRANGEDPAEALLTVLGSREPGGRGQFGAGSPASRHATLIIDIERAMREAGPAASAEAIAVRLCPWSTNDE